MKHNLVSSVTTVEKAVLFCCDEGSDSQDPILAICIRIFHDDSFFLREIYRSVRVFKYPFIAMKAIE